MRLRYCDKYLLLLPILFILSDSCKKNDSDNNSPTPIKPAITPVGDPVGNPVTKTIGTAGGILNSPDGRFKLEIPAGALNSNTDISIQPVTNTAPGGKGLAYNLLPDGTRFNKPATITFNYSKEELPDNLPFFLNIAFQDKTGAWIPDWELRDFDTVAKTISMAVDHFTIFSMNNSIQIKGSPLNLRKNEKSGLFVIETIVEGYQKNQPLLDVSIVPNSVIKAWKVNGVENGSAADGKITQTASGATYEAPDFIDKKRTVRISAVLKIRFIVYDGKRKVAEYNSFEPGIDVTLEPDREYNYQVYINILDSTISPFYGGLSSGLPIYKDDARFEVNIKMGNHAVIGTVSDTSIKNTPPTVTPAIKSFQGTNFTWIPDPYGQLNIERVALQSYNDIPADSVISLILYHKNAAHYGFILSHTSNGDIFNDSPPVPYTGTFGIPQIIDIDLKRKDAYIQRVGAYGTYIYTSIVPK